MLKWSELNPVWNRELLLVFGSACLGPKCAGGSFVCCYFRPAEEL
jgi:hypothetical protein